MIGLIKNELIKILKRKNIYILLIVGILVISIFNLFQSFQNHHVNMKEQYERLYANDKVLLENYNTLNIKDSYEDIIERIELEKYAIENNIVYNIIINSENESIILSKDARYLLLKAFDNFDIIIIILIIYLSSTSICEEYNSGTIKKLLTKPHKRTTILLAKVGTNILVIIITTIFMLLLQYLLGGLLFGFNSYDLEAIKYNVASQNIETMHLAQNMLVMMLSKIPMYLLLSLLSMLFGVVTNNIALNILISIGLYFVSTMNFLIGNISKYLFVFNWDLTKNSITNIEQSIFISYGSLLLVFIVLIIAFNNKDIRNE